jgi:glycosyltransferase involved in cell wall biosynthesis
MPKVSCVMPTYRRFNCVERSISCFLAQETELETELIICNTDVEYPLVLDDSFSYEDLLRIKIFNSNIDLNTGKPYKSTGAIRRDGVARSTGEYYITWDDDDIFLPWNIQQCYDGLVRTGKRAWKPKKSIMWWADAPKLEFNVLEATAMMYIAEATFDENSGPEGMSWYQRLINNNQISEDEDGIPGYCYYWKDPVEIGGHKQGNALDINKPNNFELHMSRCVDHATRAFTKRNLSYYDDIISRMKFIFDDISKNKPDTYAKYVNQFFTKDTQ